MAASLHEQVAVSFAAADLHEQPEMTTSTHALQQHLQASSSALQPPPPPGLSFFSAF